MPNPNQSYINHICCDGCSSVNKIFSGALYQVNIFDKLLSVPCLPAPDLAAYAAGGSKFQQ